MPSTARTLVLTRLGSTKRPILDVMILAILLASTYLETNSAIFTYNFAKETPQKSKAWQLQIQSTLSCLVFQPLAQRRSVYGVIWILWCNVTFSFDEERIIVYAGHTKYNRMILYNQISGTFGDNYKVKLEFGHLWHDFCYVNVTLYNWLMFQIKY